MGIKNSSSKNNIKNTDIKNTGATDQVNSDEISFSGSNESNFVKFVCKICIVHPPYNTMKHDDAIDLIKYHIEMNLLDSETSFDTDDNWPTKVKRHYLPKPNHIAEKPKTVHQSDYLIRCHLNLPPYNTMKYEDAIIAIRKHCGYD